MSALVFAYRTRFSSFVDFAFRELHPGHRMKDNWHIRLMANMLQLTWCEMQADPLCKMIFNLPSGYMKTHVCSVSFPAWVLGREPEKSVLIISETPEEAREIMEQCTQLMESPRYRSIFGRLKIIKKKRGELLLNRGGGIRCAGIGQSLPQRKSDLVILDNPQSLHNLDQLKPQFVTEIARTLKDPKRGVMILSTRRLGPFDLTHFLYQKAQWATVVFPVIGLDEKKWHLPPDDRHTQLVGEPLYPGFEDWDEIENQLGLLGGENFCWQYLQGLYRPPTIGQRPAPDAHGYKWTMVGTFDLSWVVAEHLAELREKYYLMLL